MANEAVEQVQQADAIVRMQQEKEYYKQRVRDLGWSKEELKIIYSKLPAGVPIEEVFAFLTRARNLGLDPIGGQIIMQSHTMKSGEVRYTIIVGIDGYRSMAMRTGLYAPGRDTEYKYREDGTLLSATVYVKRYHQESGQWNEFSAQAFYDEYCVFFWDRDTRSRKPTQMWEKMGHTMLEKCAEAKALRRGFPETMSDIYTVEEMAQTNTATVSAEEAAKRGESLTAKAVAKLTEGS